MNKKLTIRKNSVNEIIFYVEVSDEGGFMAKALGQDIFTEGESIEELHAAVKDAVVCHFEDGEAPQVIRLHYVREEVIAV